VHATRARKPLEEEAPMRDEEEAPMRDLARERLRHPFKSVRP